MPKGEAHVFFPKVVQAADYLARQVPPAPCRCAGCVEMCSRPCYPTPDEAEKLIDHGYAHKLMLKATINDTPRVRFLCPANPAYGGGVLPMTQKVLDRVEADIKEIGYIKAIQRSIMSSGCAFQRKDGGCSLHARKLKPIGGVLATCDVWPNAEEVMLAILRLWDTSRGATLIARWREITGCTERIPAITRVG